MRARQLVSVAVAAGLVAASSFKAGADEATIDGIKSRPAAVDAQKYRPKHGCFGTGTRDAAGNTQMVCR